ncbi:MAG TPA: hypothetical protein VGQ03_01320 [Nitrososphaera sp.]|jgi:hypothetical protein|nr:hypothetical protein [Nitrososphaera sp.]
MSVEELFEVNDTDTVWDAWLTTINMVDMLEHTDGVVLHYDFVAARDKIARIYSIAEVHSIDKPETRCTCGLSKPEHAILKRKILTFYKLQVGNLKHFIY